MMSLRPDHPPLRARDLLLIQPPAGKREAKALAILAQRLKRQRERRDHDVDSHDGP